MNPTDVLLQVRLTTLLQTDKLGGPLVNRHGIPRLCLVVFIVLCHSNCRWHGVNPIRMEKLVNFGSLHAPSVRSTWSHMISSRVVLVIVLVHSNPISTTRWHVVETTDSKTTSVEAIQFNISTSPCRFMRDSLTCTGRAVVVVVVVVVKPCYESSQGVVACTIEHPASVNNLCTCNLHGTDTYIAGMIIIRRIWKPKTV